MKNRPSKGGFGMSKWGAIGQLELCIVEKAK